MSKCNNLYTIGHFGRFIDSLANNCHHLICFLHSPANNSDGIYDYRLKSPGIEWIDLGPHASVFRREILAKRYVRPIRKLCNDIDALLVRGPSPLLPAAVQAAESIPVALLLGGDYTKGIDELRHSHWRRGLIRIWTKRNKCQQNHIVKHHLTFVNSRALYEELTSFTPNLIEVRTSTLNDSDFYKRKDTCRKLPYHILYTGRITRSKGIFEIISATKQLVDRGEDIILDLVGPLEKGETITDFEQHANNLGVKNRVKYHGYRTVGPDLFSFYRDADIYVLASSSSFEGFPRTIWEAMAHSLPVVATRVGGIPGAIEDAAELVSPGNVDELADAITRLLNNKHHRQSLIRSGYKIARHNTLEVQSKVMIDHISTMVERHHRPNNS